MRKPIIIFYTLTTSLLTFVVIFNESIFAPYLINLYILFTFAESYYVLQNYDFDHGIPYGATIIKLVNTIFVTIFPLISLLIHVSCHVYLYKHVRLRIKRSKRLKYHYTVNNLISGPLVLKLFSSFLNPILFLIASLLVDMRIDQKLNKISNSNVIFYIIITDIFVLLIKFTPFASTGYLCYLIMIIIFEFVPIKNQTKHDS